MKRPTLTIGGRAGVPPMSGEGTHEKRPTPARWLWRRVRALHDWVIGIGWTDLGTAFALIVVGDICLGDGHLWRGLWCWMLGITVYVSAPRPNGGDVERRGQ